MIPLIETLEINIWLKLLIDATMKSFAMFAVAGLLGFILRRHSAAVRGLVWSLALVGCLAVPFFSLTLPQWEVGVLPATPERFQVDQLTDNRQAAVSPVPIASGPLPTATRSSVQATPTPIQPEATTSEIATRQSNTLGIGLASLHWTDWIAVCWTAGTLFLIARLLMEIGAVWHVSTCSDDFNGLISQVPPDWKRAVSMRKSDAVTVPMVWGLFRPVILLPADADEWEPERQRAVLLHELAHIQRQDWLMQTVAQITCAVYWFNPLVWFAARRMRTEVERTCDDHVLNAGYQSTDYAQHLLDAVRNIKKINTATRSAVAMARQSKIEGRLRTVLAENRNRRPITRIAVAVGLLALICFAVPMGVMQLAEAVGPEQALYKEIQAAENFQLEPLPETATEAEQAAQLEQLQQHLEHGLQLCEQFLNTYLESNRYEEVFYKKLTYISLLRRDAEFEKGVEAFFSEYPASKYTSNLRKRRAYILEFQFKYDEALAEWDKIDDPALLLEKYERKATIYAEMGNSEKAKEFNLLRAELILGKSSPEFSQIIEADKRRMEADRKQDMYWKDFFASLKSYVAVKADGEIFTGIILSQVGHILVPANVTEAETIHAKIGDYQPAKVVVVDSKSGLAVVQVDGQTELRPIVLGNIDDLQEYAPIPHLYPEVGSTSPTIVGHTYLTINVISTRGYPNAPNLPPEFHQNAFETPTYRGGSIQELKIDDGGKVAALQAGTPTGKIIGGDAFVYYDGRLLAVAVDNEVRYKFGSAITNPLLIDQIRAALKRMNMIELMESQSKKPAQ
ncbi:hypothetical protein C6502_22160 [Candidatus Poribacteria bacterium]|nr:MAG: hypothetical protein C6502_22160 [Candidatus Poribacteria bacterium]